MADVESRAKDLAEHLRMVHFALIVTAVVLATGATQALPSDLEIAYRDAESLSKAMNELPHIVAEVTARINDPNWRKTGGSEVTNGHQGSTFLQFANETFELYTEPVYVVPRMKDEACPRLRLCDFGWPTDWRAFKNSTALPIGTDRLTITTFQILWDLRIEHLRLPLPEKGEADCGGIKVPLKPAIADHGRTIGAELVPSPLQEQLQGESGIGTYLQVPFDLAVDKNSQRSHCSFVLGKGIETVTDPRPVIANHLNRTDWDTTASFENAFAMLVRNTTIDQRDNIPLEGVVRDLSQRVLNSPPTVDMFGIKLPQQNLIVVGALLVLTCQFYFWAHLVQLRKMLSLLVESQWPTGYLLLYSSPSARWGASLTAFAGPSFMLGVTLIARRLRGVRFGFAAFSFESVFAFLAFCTSCVIGSLILCEVLRLRAASPVPATAVQPAAPNPASTKL